MTEPHTTEDAFDDRVIELLRTLDDDGTFLRELIALFRTTAASDMEELRQAVARGDAVAARAHAHRAKGSSSNLGLRALAASLATIEKSATGQPELVADAMETVERDLAAAMSYLDELAVS